MRRPAAPAPATGPYTDAARALAARYGADGGHGARVLVHARCLLAGGIDAFERPERAESYRLRLDLAALLHDVGRAVASERHNRHSRYIILHSDRTSTWPEDLRRDVAELARAHRGRVQRRRLARRLGGDADLVRLAALLRIADGLDRGHAPGVSIISFGPAGRGFSLVVTGLAERDRLRLAERKADLFARAFGRPLAIRAERVAAGVRSRDGATSASPAAGTGRRADAP
jgi:exopolyphosphatase/guanosine-5'-triphosphate,3'-diphosphate pyrophosphatase